MIIKLAFPIILGLTTQLLIILINTFFVGQLSDPNLLAGVGLGNMLINLICFSITQGLNGALETFVSQSFGAKKYSECGIYLNRGKVVDTITMIPIFVIFAFSDRILIAIGQDPSISKIAQRYCCIMIPGVWAQSIFDATTRFLNAQYIVMISLYVQIATLIIHLMLCLLFVRVFDGQDIGVANATNVTYILNMVALEIYCYREPKLSKTYLGLPNKQAFKNMKTYLWIGISGAFLACLEWWVFEIFAIFAGLINEK